jgi:uncharacterized protein Yka (UPF0111/DUF47 family)
MLSWFQALMPREERFFDLFDRHAVTIVAGAHALRSLLDGDEKAPEHCKEIKRYENEADEITRDVLLAVRRTFITPFDRGDIRDLITVMDDTIDQMHQTARRHSFTKYATSRPLCAAWATLLFRPPNSPKARFRFCGPCITTRAG